MNTFMKRINGKVLLFACIWLFLGINVLNPNMKYYVKETAYFALVDREPFMQIKDRLDKISNEQLRYHQELIDLHTIFQRETGSAVIEKDDGTVVVRMKNGQLHTEIKKTPEKEIEESVAEVRKLADTAEQNHAGFLYVMAPVKGDYGVFPAGVDNYAPENYSNTRNSLMKSGIPVLDLKEKMIEDGIFNGDSYFITDHHWKPLTGFWAFGKICTELNQRYGFEYDETYTDISNYTVRTKFESFLGSTGKKVGPYFSRLGVDDFDVIVPNFETELFETRPFANESKEGTFTETVCFPNNLEGNMQNKNDYAYYSGGDFRLQRFENLKNPDGKRILLVRDSFACTVAPFLVLQAKELVITDTRNYEYYVGPKQNVHEMIRELKPDYVVILYSGGAGNGAGRFDFN